MARYKNGPNGPFYGKVGSIVGSSWRGLPYIKSLPRESSKPATEKQTSTRSKFGYVSSWVSKFKPFTDITLNHSPTKTAHNIAISLNIDLVTGAPGNFGITKEGVVLSDGILPQVEDLTLTLEPGKLHLTWNPQSEGGSPADQMLLALRAFTDLPYVDVVVGYASRYDGGFTYIFPDICKGHQMYGYLAFSSIDRKNFSRSQYIGEFTVL